MYMSSDNLQERQFGVYAEANGPVFVDSKQGKQLICSIEENSHMYTLRESLEILQKTTANALLFGGNTTPKPTPEASIPIPTALQIGKDLLSHGVCLCRVIGFI